MSVPGRDDPIAHHPNGCPCLRCVGLVACHACGQQKLDADWCWHCARLVLAALPPAGHAGMCSRPAAVVAWDRGSFPAPCRTGNSSPGRGLFSDVCRGVVR